MDNLLNGMYEVFSKILPFIGCLTLIALIVLMNKIILLLHDLTFTMKKINGTIDQVDETITQVNGTIDKFQTPVDTIVNISRSADKVNDYANKTVSDAIAFLSENINAFLDWLKNFLSKNKEEEDAAELQPADNEEGDNENE